MPPWPNEGRNKRYSIPKKWQVSLWNAEQHLRQAESLLQFVEGTKDNGGARGSDTVLQVGRSRVQDPRGWTSFLIYLMLAAALGPGDYSTSNRSRKLMLLGSKRSWWVGLTNLPPSVNQLSRQCGMLNITACYGDNLFFYFLRRNIDSQKYSIIQVWPLGQWLCCRMSDICQLLSWTVPHSLPALHLSHRTRNPIPRDRKWTLACYWRTERCSWGSDPRLMKA
jgi:hypothetical protein